MEAVLLGVHRSFRETLEELARHALTKVKISER